MFKKMEINEYLHSSFLICLVDSFLREFYCDSEVTFFVYKIQNITFTGEKQKKT